MDTIASPTITTSLTATPHDGSSAVDPEPAGEARRHRVRWTRPALALAAIAAGLALGATGLLLIALLFVAVVPFEKAFPRHRQLLRPPGLGTDLTHAVAQPVLAGVSVAAALVVGVVSLAWLLGAPDRPTRRPVPGIEVVGEVGDGDEALAVVEATQPDVVLMDVRRPGRDGIDATAEITRRVAAARAPVLTTFDEDGHVGAHRGGAAGFLLKNASTEVLVRAVTPVAAGDGVLDQPSPL